MTERFEIQFPLADGSSERRTAYIYLPESYAWDHNRQYPVLYMFDGHNVFFDSDATYGKSWGMQEYMDRTGTQLIIAAVECNHSPNHGRLIEYSPFDFSDSRCGSIKGRGKETMEWLIHQFKPQIDRNYRTLSDRKHTSIAGSSMGGLMSIYALLEYNAFFSRAAALSPSLWTAPEKVSKMISEAAVAADTVLYMDYGSKEFQNQEMMHSQFRQCADRLMERGVMLHCRIVPGGNHCEASWERQIPFFVPTLLYEDN